MRRLRETVKSGLAACESSLFAALLCAPLRAVDDVQRAVAARWLRVDACVRTSTERSSYSDRRTRKLPSVL